MKRLFGGSKSKEKVNIGDVTSRMNARNEVIEVKIDKLSEELVKLKGMIEKSHGSTQKRYIERAKVILHQKRSYESQLQSLQQQIFNTESLQFTTEMIRDSRAQYDVMKDAGKQLKKEIKQIPINKVEDLSDDLLDLYNDAQEIQEIMGRNYDIQEVMDDDDILDELDALAMDTSAGQQSSYLDEALSTPVNPITSGLSGETTGDASRHDKADSLEVHLGL